MGLYNIVLLVDDVSRKLIMKREGHERTLPEPKRVVLKTLIVSSCVFVLTSIPVSVYTGK